ncbi:phospholipase D/nuclease [Heliocybe sulcata]|uniref:Phospholipase n=1 Tax=Heliocybe sulcata TaxID=5364 RepID=A0A5C3N1P5_9AGAM|nr:phospholipase D/nuclease [Heliocybe sulcata]
MSFLHKIAGKTVEGIEHAKLSIEGIVNPDRRHDDPEEKMHDEIRAQIMAGHRFQSFADERAENFVKWHIDGHDYMYALSEMLDSAKECIFILDWWLTPELFLRRPPSYHPEWRLDRVLKRKAEQGVKIYVVVYKEVTQTMSMSSHHTKVVLEALHPNIACMRHPDHIGSKDDVEFWSHHEKVVVVDNDRACIGGLDLCFGRWDTHTHPLADVHPTDFSLTLFPGQDYNNARILDFQKVEQFASSTVSILESGRMPWHDVHMTLEGPVVLDIVQHFTERWNEVKKRKYRTDERYDWLALPHNINAAPNEPVARHPHREKWQSMGHRFKQRFQREEGEEQEEGYARPSPNGSMRVQAVRSVSDWSHGVLTEHSIQNAYCQLIREANHFIYIENQFFISNTTTEGPVKNLIAQALVERIIQAAKDGTKFKVIIILPELPAFAGDVKSESSLQYIMAGQYRTINRGGHSIYEEIRKAGYEPMDYIRFYHLRAYDRLNAPLTTFIAEMEKNSGVKFHQAQVAYARQIVGDMSDDINRPDAQKNVTIQIPQASSEGMVVSEKTEVKTETIPLPKSDEEATEIIKKFQDGAGPIRGDEDVSDNVIQHMLNDKTSLADEKWLGTEEEELASYISELVYIHTKLMVVDDRRVIMGSANINDRSQKGDGDSEIALVVEDEDMVKTTMDGKPYMAARFAASLRRKLFREHLGLIRPQLCEDREEEVTSFMRPAPNPNEDEMDLEEDQRVADPLSEEVQNLWNDTARKNREIFTELFRPVPTNLVRDWKAYENYVPKVKIGHVIPDIPLQQVKERLSNVRGALVEMPIDFLIDEHSFVEGPEWRGLNPTLPIYI